MKKIMIAVIVLLSVFIIYIGFKDKKIYYFSIGDGSLLLDNYTPYIQSYFDNEKLLEQHVQYIVSDLHTTELIQNIEKNIEIKVDNNKKHIQNVLIKADLITLSLGEKSFLDNNLSKDEKNNIFASSLTDFESLFKILRFYCKEEIVLIGFYIPNDNIFNNYVNKNMVALTQKYNIKYIEINEENYLDKRKISDEIIKKIDFNK